MFDSVGLSSVSFTTSDRISAVIVVCLVTGFANGLSSLSIVTWTKGWLDFKAKPARLCTEARELTASLTAALDSK